MQIYCPEIIFWIKKNYKDIWHNSFFLGKKFLIMYFRLNLISAMVISNQSIWSISIGFSLCALMNKHIFHPFFNNRKKKKKKLTQPVILTLVQKSTSLQQFSSMTGFGCSVTSTVPAEEVNTSLRTVLAFTHAFMMSSNPFIVGFITSFCISKQI